MDTNDLIKNLDCISYRTNLDKNLKNTLRKVDKQILINELNSYRTFLNKRRKLLKNYIYRIKSIQSISLKYDRYYPSKEISSCFNDILGIRVIVDNYNIDIMDIEDIIYIIKRVIIIILLRFNFLLKRIIFLIYGYISTYTNMRIMN